LSILEHQIMNMSLRTIISTSVAALLIVCAGGAASAAGDTRPEEPQQPAQQQEAPLRPPAGMSIIPSPWPGTPPTGENQPEGCPVRELAPLQLLV
jgi:hypothetical protein